MYTAIFGGTFNPLHIGHYQILSSLQNDDRIEEILIMPDKIPPHKVCDFIADDEIRIEMCKIAARNFAKAKVCLIEFEREGKSYTFDTIIELKNKYPTKKFIFSCGGDMLVTLHEWYNYRELIKILDFLAFRREDTDNDLFDKRIKELSKQGARIIVSNDVITGVSSSQIRNNFISSQKLLPNDIFEFLKQRNVYND